MKDEMTKKKRSSPSTSFPSLLAAATGESLPLPGAVPRDLKKLIDQIRRFWTRPSETIRVSERSVDLAGRFVQDVLNDEERIVLVQVLELRMFSGTDSCVEPEWDKHTAVLGVIIAKWRAFRESHGVASDTPES